MPEGTYILDDLVGLKKRLASRQLLGAVDDGSIVQHVSWQVVLPGNVVFVGGIAGFMACRGVGVQVQHRHVGTTQ